MKNSTAQLRQSNTGDVVKKKKRGKSDEVKNGVFIEDDVTYIPSSESDVKKKKKKAKIYEGVQTLEEGAEGEEGERASAGVFGSPQSEKKDSSASSSLGISKLRSKPE